MLNQELKTKYLPLQTAISNISTEQSELCRIFHGRGHVYDALSHLNLDFYPPYLFLISYEKIDTEELALVTELIWQQAKHLIPNQVKGLIYQHRSGRETQSVVVEGDDPKSFTVQELGLNYQVNLTSSQNTGIFPDMKMGRQWLMSEAKDCKVLNLFSYTCGFSLAAMHGGATQVVNMDMNKGVLRTGKINHQLNNIKNGVSYYPHDILKSFGKLKKLGPFDIVVIDPPSFQKGSFILTKDYQKILRRLTEILSHDAKVLLCANSPELSEQSFKALIDEHVNGNFKFITRLSPAPNFIEADENRSLKALVYCFKH